MTSPTIKFNSVLGRKWIYILKESFSGTYSVLYASWTQIGTVILPKVIHTILEEKR
jgi:hypothetical protein